MAFVDIATPLVQAEDNNGDFSVINFELGWASDLVFFKRRNTESNTIEIHELSARTLYQGFGLHTATALSQQEDQNGDFYLGIFNDNAYRPDLFFIKRRNTDSNTIEVHVLSGNSGYQDFLLHTPTPLSQNEDQNGDFAIADFNGDGTRDLVFIKRRNTDSGTIELHVLSAKSGYQEFTLHADTALAQSEDQNGDFSFVFLDALAFIKRRNTDSNMVELHVLSPQSGYKEFWVHTATCFPQSEDANGDFQIGMLGFGAAGFFFVKRRNTESDQIEVHVCELPQLSALDADGSQPSPQPPEGFGNPPNYGPGLPQKQFGRRFEPQKRFARRFEKQR
ncbi:hypothetical protein [Burkholderia sp. F1]|uniref:hypothetical protein n=1 Tax=Burkholderia sp. F1 TaxID=3366817 RepID=UPI003D765E7E